MNAKRISVLTAFLIVLILVFSQTALANDLFIVASKDTQQAVKNWLGFLESKEIPVKTVTPDTFSNHKNELYIVIIGSINEPGGIGQIAKEALTAEEFQSISKNGEGKMFFKPQAWNVGQKVILFVGPDQTAADTARKASKNEWFEMFQDWFDIEDTEGLHTY
jgi:hypothetical protein